MSHLAYRTLVRPRVRQITDAEPAFAHGAVSPWHGLLALYGRFETLEPVAGMWLITANTEQGMRSCLAQIAEVLNDRGWSCDRKGLWAWWRSKTVLGVVASLYETVRGDDSGEGEYV